MTDFFFWNGVGVVVLFPLALLIIGATWLFAYCRSVAYHAKRTYLKSRLRKQLTAKEGLYVSWWLIRYNARHGFGYDKFTAVEWNNYFSKLLNKD